MYRIHHPNVVKLFGHFEDNTFCYYVMEYIPKGNLYSLVPKNGIKVINDQMVASLTKDVISALYYLHHMNPPIIHRDIKPENILIDDQMRAKLSDFGWSNYLKGDYKRTTLCGTPIYLAPEVVNNYGHDEKIDIWCVGVLMFELLTGMPPWKGEDVTTVKRNIIQLKINWPKNMDKDAKDLIGKILRYMPEERPSLRSILMHRFFTKYFPNAVNCLQAPTSERPRLYLISKDHPLTYNEGLNNNLYNEVMPIQSLPNTYNNATSVNQFDLNSFSKSDYNQSRATISYTTPMKSINYSNNYFNENNSSSYTVPSFNNDLISDYNQTRNTFTYNTLNNSILPKNDYNFSRYTINKIMNDQSQIEYNNNNIISSNGYSLLPRNTIKIKELIDNQNRINELVRRTVIGSILNKNYQDNNYQNIYDQIGSSLRPTIRETQYRTLRPNYYSDTNLSIYTNNINNSSHNNKDSYTLNNNNYYNFNDYDFMNIINDPDINKWKEEERLRKENERLKLSSLMNRYGMSLTPIYNNNNNKYNFF